VRACVSWFSSYGEQACLGDSVFQSFNEMLPMDSTIYMLLLLLITCFCIEVYC